MKLLATDQDTGVIVIAVACVAYLIAFSVARGARRRRARGRRDGSAPAGWAARLLGSAGVVLAIVSPAAAGGGKPAGRPGGQSRSATAPPWPSNASDMAAPDSVEAAQRSDRPWDSVSGRQFGSPETKSDSAESSAPPWSEDGSSPPRPFLRTGAEADSRRAPQNEAEKRGSSSSSRSRAAGTSPVGETRQAVERREWTVRTGDTLWDIAAQVLRTSDRARIARYWPAIHRANREVIGANPSLIFPGQVLRLPDEEPRR